MAVRPSRWKTISRQLSTSTVLFPLVAAARRKPSQSLKDARYQPTPRQVRQLSKQLALTLSEQLRSTHKAFDALFNLRQLHLFQPPNFYPSTSTSEGPRLERWLWRLPASTAIHAIIKGAADVPDQQSRGELLKAALALAFNALRWDTICSAVVAQENGLAIPPSWAHIHAAAFSEIATQSDDAPALKVPVTRSLKPTTLAALFGALREAGLDTEAFALARAMVMLDQPVPRSIRKDCIVLALTLSKGQKYKMTATQLFAELALDPAARSADLEHAWTLLQPSLARTSSTFKANARKRTAHCVSTLLPVFSARIESRSGSPLDDKEWRVETALLNLLANYGRQIDLGRSDITAEEAEVLQEIRTTLASLLSRWLGRTVTIDVASVAFDPDKAIDAKRVSLSSLEVTRLLDFATRHEPNATLAHAVVSKVVRSSLAITPALVKVLLPVIARDDAHEAMALSNLASSSFSPDARHKSSRSDREHEAMLATLVHTLARQRAFKHVNDVTFALLPELELTSRRAPIRPPPDRSPWLYVALLRFAALAGRTGLAERIFRLMRWSAERSATATFDLSTTLTSTVTAADAKNTGEWFVPPAAYTIMLQLYAAEVKIGRAIARSAGPNEGLEAKGWGQGAIDKLIAEGRAAELGLGLDTAPTLATTTSNDRREGRGEGVAVARHVLAPFAADYLLRETSAREKDRQVYARALVSQWSVNAVRILFGTEPEQWQLKRWSKRKTVRKQRWN